MDQEVCETGEREQSEERFEYLNCNLLSTSPAEAVCGDSPGDRNDDMAIEDNTDLNWDDDTNFGSADKGKLGVLPLPPPPDNYDLATVPTRPDSPNYQSDLDQLFSNDPNSEVIESSFPGVCGLCNLGNTCYMNSGLQCLFNTPALIQLFITYGKENATDTLATHFATLIQKVWSGKYSKVKPSEFHQALANLHSQFKDYRQHDCQEFLALLLGSLHEVLNTASAKSHVSDISADPMTPRSICDEPNVIDPSCQITLGGRCEASSSSSRSSESSVATSHVSLSLRNRPLPEDVEPFKTVTNSFGETMDAISEPNYELLSEEETQDGEVTSNLISQDDLKRHSKSNVNMTASMNNSQSNLYQDIMKDAKTSNINVLVPESSVNNEIVFDSEKFPKLEISRRREAIENPNLTENYNFEGKAVNIKRLNNSNELFQTELEYEASPGAFNSSKRFKFEVCQEKEKNLRMEHERKLRVDEEKCFDDDAGEFSGAMALHCASAEALLDDDIAADKQWEKHLALNQSVIFDSFQGQFKSTVVCSECQHVSSTYEPFMYLSVPLPHAMEHQMCVTFIPATAGPPTRLLLNLNKNDRVLHIKQQLCSILDVANPHSIQLEVAQVLHHHIARILDENYHIRYISSCDPNRSIYVFEMSDDISLSEDDGTGASGDSVFSEPLDLSSDLVSPNLGELLNNQDCTVRKGRAEEVEPTTDQTEESKPLHFTNNLQTSSTQTSTAQANNEPKSCAICFEEMETGIKNHRGCSCFLCDNCIGSAVSHYNDEVAEISENKPSGGLMRCPVCNVVVAPATDFVDGDEINVQKAVRILRLPVLFRQDKSDGEVRLFGHPCLIRVPSRLTGSQLYKLVARLIPYPEDYSIVFVDGQGYHCSRCMYNVHCKGCLVPLDQEIRLQSGDNLAVKFSSSVIEIPTVQHKSLVHLRKQDQLSMYDCLDAFCESETLDEQNPWYCPACERNQCATKTLSVWRYPDFLIIILKRFVYHENTIIKLDNKVSFPLTDLSLGPTSPVPELCMGAGASIHPGLSRKYDLYACVNHLGGASAGHYTAYAKNPQSGEWHLFNDETVTAQRPEESDFCNAYILFYQKQGGQPPNTMLSSFLGASCL